MIVDCRLPLKEVRTLPTTSFTVYACTFQVLVRNVPTDQLIFLTNTLARSSPVKNCLICATFQYGGVSVK